MLHCTVGESDESITIRRGHVRSRSDPVNNQQSLRRLRVITTDNIAMDNMLFRKLPFDKIKNTIAD